MINLGVMQGRLLAKYNGRYQAHPLNYWQKEFSIAKDLKLDCIEFILDHNDLDKSPLIYNDGYKEIISQIENSKVKVLTICADYFMQFPLHSEDKLVAEKSFSILKKLIKTAYLIGAKDIVIPCVDNSSFKNNKLKKEKFIKQVNRLLDDLDENNINLSLETDLGPQEFYDLIKTIDNKNITINYDIGNSASLGFDCEEELNLYGDKITDIHIKDRLLGGESVILGNGNANFEIFFKKLSEINYKGPLIMQAFRDDEGVGIFKTQLEWIKRYLP
jgi:L-ribulose-5-phosphate 3-epimerase